jgi:dihydrolipoamide dehydrogenase
MEADVENQTAEVLVLGGGPGGYTAAFRAADLGKRVVLVDREPALGGVCLNVGCIPSKALLHAAKVIAETKEMSENGITFGAPAIDLDKLRAWKEGVVGRLTGGLAGLAKQRKVTTIRGYGRFTCPHQLQVELAEGGTTTVGFEQAIIAAGSEALTLPFIPASDPRVIDSTGALELGEVPRRLLVIGGGIIGLEMACVYHELGAKITIVELLDQLIPGTDKDLISPLAKRITRQYENIYVKTKVTGVQARPEGLTVSFDGPKAPATDTFDRILVAVGRSPNGNLIGAGQAGVAVDDRGFIGVSKQMRTNVPHIFAIGDIVGQPMLAHKAMHEATVAAEVIAGQEQLLRRPRHPVGRLHRPGGGLGRRHRERGQGGRHRVRQGGLPVGRQRPLTHPRPVRRADQGAVRRGDRPGHRLRHYRAERGRPDRRGGAGHRDGC